MNPSIKIMLDSSPTQLNKPLILSNLPDFSLPQPKCSLGSTQRLDLILLALEALELGGSEYMLALADQLELKEIIKNRVVLWRLRCANPWRKAYNRDGLTLDQAKALVIIASYLSKQLTVLIRQLLTAEEQMRAKQLPFNYHFRLGEYLERFSSHFISRMNPRRSKVAIYLSSPDELNELALSLLNQLLFCTGTMGMKRLWFSLFDGEVV
jgi:hypothetical protein